MFKHNLKIGDRVLCRFFNSVEKAFYGDQWIGEIKDIKIPQDDMPWWKYKSILVTQPHLSYQSPDVWLHDYEILRRMNE